MSTPSPKLLCIDVGNTMVKAAVGDGTRWMHLPSLPTARLNRKQPWAGRDLAGVAAVVVSSVVPRVNRSINRAAKRMTGRAAWFIDHRWPFPFRLDVSAPRAVGVDRLCAALGAVRRRVGTVIVVDVGSAITVDLVSRGAYRGGLILAGPGLTLRCLGDFAEQLPRIDFAKVKRPFSGPRRGTRSSMVVGAGYAAVGAVKEAVRYLRGTTAKRPRVVITGGGSAVLRRRLPRTWSYRPDLVLDGLYAAGCQRLASKSNNL